ncbi:hypothetical protein ACFPES_04190 [Paenibacillus sp. GCM10023248]|uniref:hypothetical protein n=1 Tax=unclassified Paenibacillus TaxID=185978 RepID=UPI00237848A7|nr:hypothetical protein [Paenibacillus sp. MAHUQ-63]MDD9266224.1 hypothetical protein [Paenibacillus sp. MAHUQ-63]
MQSQTIFRPILKNTFVKAHFILTAVLLYILTCYYLYEPNIYGTILINLSLLPFMLALPFGNKKLSILYFFLMYVGISRYSLSNDPLQFPDSQMYFEELITHGNYYDLITFFWNELCTGFQIDTQNNLVFALLYYPMFYFLHNNDPAFITTYNALLYIITGYLTYRLLKKHSVFTDKIINIILLGLFGSASLQYWSSFFLKDITSLFLIVLALNLFMNKKFIWFLFVMFFAYSLRVYSPVIILCHILLLKGYIRFSLLGAIFALVVEVYNVGLKGVINSLLNVGNMFSSPSPFNIENWKFQGYRTFESLIFLIILLLVIVVFLLNKESRSFYLTAFSVIYIYSAVVTIAGFQNLEYLGLDYVIGNFGDDMTRKKISIIIIIYIVFAYTFIQLSDKKVINYNKM